MKSTVWSLLVVVYLSLIFSSCQNKDNFKDFIHFQCDSLLSNTNIQSLSVGVIKNGNVYKLHKGKLLNGESPNDQTLYEIASLTKTFTGTLLAKAIADNKVKIDDDIRVFLPAKFPNLAYNEQSITFRHLVTHTSGLPYMFPDQPELFQNSNWDELPFQINEIQKDFTRNDFLKELHQVKLDTVPGHLFNYSNAGANLLGYCLERTYNKRYDELLEEYLFTPLEMHHSYSNITSEHNAQLARGVNVNGIKMPSRATKELQAEGGIVSNLDDMISYMKFQLNENNALVKIAHQELLNGKYGDFENGLFWQIFKNGEKPTKIYQNGGAFGTSSWLTLIPETNSAVFVVTNVSGPDIHQKLNFLVDAITEYSE